MKQAWQVLKYIIRQNSVLQIPQRLIISLAFQVYKRTAHKILTKTLFNGKKILLFPNNPIASAFVYCPIPDRKEILKLRELADQSTIFLDIGANIGAYSIMLLDVVHSVYAFEAHPLTASHCKMNFVLNNIEVSHVLPFAVSDNTEKKYFTNFSHGSPVNMLSHEKNGIEVPGITLDQFMQDKNFSQDHSFILKIDVEGFEYEVFQGAQEFLKNNKIKAIIFENFSPELEKIKVLLAKFNFTLHNISEHNMLALK